MMTATERRMFYQKAAGAWRCAQTRSCEMYRRFKLR
jgi:hypothetical protein